MKYIITCMIFLSGYSASFAQIPAGTRTLGGNIFYQDIDQAYNNINHQARSFGIALNMARFYKTNNAFGFSLGYNPYTTRNEPAGGLDTEHSTNSFSAGVLVRKYAYLGSKFYIFGHGALDLSYSRTRDKLEGLGTSSKSKSWNTTVSLMPGFAYQVFRNAQLELTLPRVLSIGYGRDRTEFASGDILKGSNYGISTQLSNDNLLNSLGIGFRLFI